MVVLFLNNTIPETALQENFGMNEHWVWLKTGYLLSGIAKTLRLAVNGPVNHQIF
jgi:hypothetical protein